MRYSLFYILVLISLTTTGCVKENRVATESDPSGADASMTNGESNGGNAGETMAGAGGEAGEGGTNEGGEAGEGGTNEGGSGGGTNEGGNQNEGGEAGSTSTNPNRGPGCQSYCDRINDCLVPACPGLDSFFDDEVCDEWCGGGSDFQLGEFADRECGEFNEILLGTSPELTEFCSDEPIPDVCEDICVGFNECGFEIEQQVCLRICRGYEPDRRNCAANAAACGELFQCVDDEEPEDRIDYEEVCEGKCFREFQCVRNVCASGTLEIDDAFGDGIFESCTETCIREEPPIEELQAVFGGMCIDIVAQLRQDSPTIDARCDNEPDQVCELLCDKATDCPGSVSRAECLTSCASWDEANRLCVDNTPREACERMNRCYGDEGGQARCRQFCDHLQGCLIEACPPQIIDPDYTDECTSGCLFQPPAQRFVDEYTNTACRQVRAQVYQDNPGLRPVCDGGQDFRPTAAECTDVCEMSLDECIVGGQTQCVGLCRTLTRDEYTCAIADGATCMSIDNCLQ